MLLYRYLSQTKLISSREMDEIPGLIHKKGGQIRIVEGSNGFLFNYLKRDVIKVYFYMHWNVIKHNNVISAHELRS